MAPFVGVPKTIAQGMSAYREVFGRAEGFEHVKGELYICRVCFLPTVATRGRKVETNSGLLTTRVG